MKLKITLLLMMFGASAAYSQKYKIKDDVLYKGKKEQAGKIAGKSNQSTTDVEITTMEGDEILKISAGFFNPNPFLKSYGWYTIRFADSGKEMKVKHQGLCGKKCLVKRALVANGVVVENQPVANQEQIIETYDISPQLAVDTMEVLKEHEEMVAKLKNSTIDRELTAKVNLQKIKEDKQSYGESGSRTTTTYEIYQTQEVLGETQKIVVGRIVKIVNISSNLGSSFKYSVYEKMQDSNEFVPACKVLSTTATITFRTVVDGKEHSKFLEKNQRVVRLLADYLVENRYL